MFVNHVVWGLRRQKGPARRLQAVGFLLSTWKLGRTQSILLNRHLMGKRKLLETVKVHSKSCANDLPQWGGFGSFFTGNL